MFRFPRPRPLLVAALLAACSGLSQASLSFGWSLLDWNPVLGPTDTLVLRATLFNDASSTEPLRGDRLLGRFAEGIEDVYDFADAVPTLVAQLQGVELDPGEGMDFVFGRLLPQGGRAAEGRYSGGGMALAFADDSGREVSWSPDRTLFVTVSNRDGGGGSVPEPGVAALLAVAAAAAALSRRVARRS